MNGKLLVTSCKLRASLGAVAHDAQCSQPETRNPKLAPSAFTLTELLVVITILAVLAGLTTPAVFRALIESKQTLITAEIIQLSQTLEVFKDTYGAYPPNVYSNSDSTLNLTNAEKNANADKLRTFLTKAFNKSTEFNTTKPANSSENNISIVSDIGLTASEAVVFWLQGFSSDVERPLSGSDLELTSINDNGTTVHNVVTIDARKPLYDFERGRLHISRAADGSRRFLAMQNAAGLSFQVQLYEYYPEGSRRPLVYFDTSRETPRQIVDNWETKEFSFVANQSGAEVFALKQIRADAPEPAGRVAPFVQYVDYVEKGKFQILHCGIDDIWGISPQTTRSQTAS